MASPYPSFQTSPRPLTSYYDEGDEYGTDPNSVDVDNLPEGWTAQGASLLAGNVNRSPVEQATYNLGLQDLARKATQQTQTDNVLRELPNLDLSTPEGLTGLQRLSQLNPGFASSPYGQHILSQQQQIRTLQQQPKLSPYSPDVTDLLAEGLNIDPTNPDSHKAWLNKLNANRGLLQDPRVYNMAAKVNNDYQRIATRAPKAGFPEGFDDFASEINSIKENDEDAEDRLALAVQANPQAVNTRAGRELLISKQRKLKNYAASQSLKPLHPADAERINKYDDAAEEDWMPPLGREPTVAEKAAYLAEHGITDPAEATAQKWTEAYNALTKGNAAYQKASKRIEALAKARYDVSPVLLNKYNIAPPKRAVTSAGAPIKSIAPQQQDVPQEEALPVPQAAAQAAPTLPQTLDDLNQMIQDLAKKHTEAALDSKNTSGKTYQELQQLKADQQALVKDNTDKLQNNYAWTNAKQKLEKQLQSKFTPQELQSIYNSILKRELQGPMSREGAGEGSIDPETWFLNQAKINPSEPAIIKRPDGKDATKWFGRKFSNSEVLSELAKERTSNPSPVSQVAQQPSQAIPVTNITKEQYQSAPSGTRFQFPDGTIKIKP